MAQGFAGDDCQHRQQMRGLIRFRVLHELHIARELFEKIIHRQFVIRRMQHPLAKYTKVVREILGGGVQANSIEILLMQVIMAR